MKQHFKKVTAVALSLAFVLSAFVGLNITATAAASQINIQMVDYPRGGGGTVNDWGHPAMHLMNGWSEPSSTYYSVKGDADNGMAIAYCVQPGVALNSGDTLPTILPTDFLDTYNNGQLDSGQIEQFIGRIFQFGYTGTVTLSMSNADLAQTIATQLLVWETIVGERDVNFNHVAPPAGYNAVLDYVPVGHPLCSQILADYNSIVASVQARSKVPSFMAKNANVANTVELTWDGSKYTTTLTDTNGVLGNYTFSSTTQGINFSISGNNLTISSTSPPNGTIAITANRNGIMRSAVAFWCSNAIVVKGKVQALTTVGQDVTDPLPAYLNVKVSYGSMSIIKTTEYNGGAVNGFTFEVSNSSGTLVGTYTTDSSGKIDIPNLMPGTYSVKEVNLSSDFVTPTPNPKSVVVNAGQNASVSFDNIRKRGVITVLKSDANPTMGGYSLAGAVFEVRDQGQNLVDTITTDSTGTAKTQILPLGVYTIKEKTAPYGFVLDTTTYTAALSGTLGTADVVYSPNTSVAEQPQVGRINIVKSNDAPNMGDYNLAGTVFEIRDANGTLVDTVTTDASGKSQSKDLKLGDYTVSEKNAPYGYVKNTGSFKVSLVYGDQTVSCVYGTASVPEHPETGIIRVHKQDANPSMGDYPLNGAVFEVRAAQDIKQLDGTVIYNKGDLADTITTDAQGNAQTKELPLGAYTVTEKTAPYGFVLNTDTKNPVLSYKDQDTAITYTDVTVPEQPQVGTINITKLDVTTGTTAQGDSTLNGAVFEVYSAADIKKLDGSIIYSKDQLVDTLYCGSTSSATSKELPLGNYYYKEKTPPVGYTLDPNSYPVAITYQGQNVAVVQKVGDLKNKVIQGQISILKHTDEPDPAVSPANDQVQQPLQGAVFQVFLKSSGSYNAAKATERDLLTTDENGYAITQLLPYGIYTVKEISAPGDYKLVDAFDVFISADGHIYQYICDDPMFHSLVKIVKVDSETGKTIPMAGTSFKVKDLSTGQWVVQHINYPTPVDIDTFETAPDGTLVMPESLKSGDYELYEVNAPYGYVKTTTPVKFTVNSTQADPALATVTMANAPAKGIIKVEKQGDMLTGVTVTGTAFGKQNTPVFSLTGLPGATFNVVAEHDRQPFELPPANENMRRVYAYLIKQRCIDRDVIYQFAHRGLVYEDAQYHNAVFVGTDQDGQPRHAHKKSTSLNDSSYRGNQTGSEAAFSFHHVGTSDTVYTFEAPIDMLSFISMYPKGWQQDSYVTLCSVADHALFRQLDDHQNLQKVILCLDNDDAGRQAMDRIADKLAAKGYTDVSILLPTLKDWNEVLQADCGKLNTAPIQEPAADDQTGGMVMQ